ncbi:MAG: triose-phosphate isomerase [bacterium]|nr:triose-phosphate isomerase [bacterium]
MRKPIIAGNWKLNKMVNGAMELVDELKPLIAGAENVEVVVCPTFTALYAVNMSIVDSSIMLGAQDCYWKESGAYTGEVSVPMLQDIGCKYVIVGHSERRQFFGETDETVNNKVKAVLQNGLNPIMCVGESLEQRKSGTTDDVIVSQVEKGLDGLSTQDAVAVVIAYEPIWAIGTGETCDAGEANRVCGLIRSTVAAHFGQDVADAVRIQYGGSVTPDTVDDLMSRSDIDGALVGGASLVAEKFARIVNFKR